MARIVDDFPNQSQRRTFYPWDEWLDGQVRILTHGEDFTIPIYSFRTLVAGTARKRALTARTRVVSETEMAVQAVGARNGHGAE